jgi:molybdopterin biosynthesis enzyme
MQGFTRRHTVQEALSWLDAQLRTLDAEDVPLRDAAGRVLASLVISDIDVPGFDRATMDGYAVVADSTEGATPYNRVPLSVVGDAMPGAPFTRTITRGQAVRIMTGAPMPSGSNAVLPAESVDTNDRRGESSAFAEAPADRLDPPSLDAPRTIAAISEVSPQKNVGHRGEDIIRGTTLLEAGRVLRPQDIGVMSSIGLATTRVVRRPRVRLVISGNELLPAGSKPHDYQITDANGPMLAALVERDGGVVDFPGLVRDEAPAILEALGVTVQSPEPKEQSPDIIIVSGGSSVGIEDLGQRVEILRGRALANENRHSLSEFLARLGRTRRLMVGADAGGEIAVQRHAAQQRRVPVDVAILERLEHGEHEALDAGSELSRDVVFERRRRRGLCREGIAQADARCRMRAGDEPIRDEAEHVAVRGVVPRRPRGLLGRGPAR